MPSKTSQRVRSSEAAFDSPTWHGEVLRETEQLVRDGKANFSDWQTARRRIHGKAGRMA